MISAHVSFSISPDKDVPFKKLIDADSIKVLQELQELSFNATQEYLIETELSQMKVIASA